MDCIIIIDHVLPGVWLNDNYDVVCVVLFSRVFPCLRRLARVSYNLCMCQDNYTEKFRAFSY